MLRTKLLTYDIRILSEVKSKARSIAYKDKVLLGVVLSNLLSAVRKGLSIVYSRNTSNAAVNTRRKITTRQVIHCMAFLEKEGYVYNNVGKGAKSPEHRIPSTITPTEKFMKEFQVQERTFEQVEQDYLEAYAGLVLRNAAKEDIEFKMTADLQRMKDVVQALNKMNHKHVILDGDGQSLSNIYTRIFNESFEYGGRFYRADILSLHNHISNQRLDVSIDGYPVVEVDYQNLHFRIAAILEGVDMQYVPFDVYTAVLDDPSNKVDRRIVKVAVNIMFNCTSKESAKRAIQGEINALTDEDKIKYSIGSARSVISLIEQEYWEFEELFYREDSYGRILQNKDSNLASSILEEFTKKEIPILCVHDSFIVAKQHLGLLCETMSCKFKESFNTKADVPLCIKWKESTGEVLERKVIM